jgi:16S rRNA (guanine(966)-N(2))-methyltransferase RsmD
MRVITGIAGGRKLKSPEGEAVRPTTDQVKQAIFNILQFDLEGRRVLDLFGGTGQLGIEALSRGASYCLFADASRKSLNLVKQNLDHCKVEEETRIAAGDYSKVLKSLAGRIEDGREEPFDIILLDPPYDAGFLDEVFRLIAEGGVLSSGGIIVAEHRKQIEMPDELYGFTRTKERRYGVVKLSIYNNM